MFDISIVAVVLGFILRGRLSNLAEVQVKGLALAVAVVVVQYGSQYAANAGWVALRPYGPYIYVVTLLFLLGVIWLNRRNPAMVLIGLGIFLNVLVITANGGKMPVSTEGLRQAGLDHYVEALGSEEVLTHQLLSDGTRLRFLSDIFVLARPYPRPRVFSVGDVVLALGALWFVVGGMLAHPSVTGKRRAAEVRRLTMPL